MHLSREIRVCFVTIILLLSSLSILTIFTYNSKAEESVGTTTLYFHEQIIEDEILSELLAIYNEEKLLDLIGGISEDELENMTAGDILKLLSSYGYGRLMDQNPPIKTNDSEHPPAIKTIIDICRKGEWEELLSEEFLVSYLAPFQGAYVYNGEDTKELNGDVKFSLYFSSPPWYLWDNDTVNVSFSVLKISDDYLEEKFTQSKEVKVKRKLLSPLKDTIQYTFSIPAETTLEPGDLILAEIKISAGEKLILDYMDFDLSSLNETLKSLGEVLSDISFLSNISETLLNLSEIFGSEEFAAFNISELIGIISSSFLIYDSVNHKSSMILPCSISGDEDNIRTYYLHAENKMDKDAPENDKPSKAVISKQSAKWSTPGLERNKLVEAATASLYIDHSDMRRLINILHGKIKVVATLLDGEEEIASAEKELERTGILDLLQKPSEPILFNFDCKNYEVKYGKNLTLEVSVTDNKLGLFRIANLLYDSVDYPSSLTVKFNETGHIKIVDLVKDPSDEEIALGDSIIYTFNVTSKYKEDNIEISFSKKDNDWDITITPEKFSLAAGGKQNVKVVIKSKADKYKEDRYGDFLSGKFAVEGKTGKVVYPVNVEISEDAVEFNIGINVESKDIKYGTSGTYIFKVKNLNTGFWPDTYTIEVESQHNWELNLSKDKIEDIDVGDEVEVEVTVSVPKNTSASSDLLKFNVTSEEGKKTVTFNVTTTVIGPNILEWIYDAFDSASHSLGLDDIFGSYGPHVLAVMIFIIIFFIVILLVYFLTIKYANVICLERIKEIQPGEEARFNITLQNPYKKNLSYEIYTRYPSSSSWNVSLSINSISLDRKQSKDFILSIKPTSFVKADDSIEVVVGVKVLEKQKNIEIFTVTTIKDAKPDLQITDVVHSPEIFKKGDRVETSFKLENRGNVAATNVSVILYVNGEEKNKVEDITIPGGGYAEIRMPWIANKGKNEFNIVVK